MKNSLTGAGRDIRPELRQRVTWPIKIKTKEDGEGRGTVKRSDQEKRLQLREERVLSKKKGLSTS